METEEEGEKEEAENGKRDHAAFLLRLKVTVGTRSHCAVPAGQPHVVSITVLLRAVLVTHPLPATLEENVQTTAGHRLVAVPVGNVSARRRAISQAHLTVLALAQRVAVLFSVAVEVTRTNEDGLCVGE